MGWLFIAAAASDRYRHSCNRPSLDALTMLRVACTREPSWSHCVTHTRQPHSTVTLGSHTLDSHTRQPHQPDTFDSHTSVTLTGNLQDALLQVCRRLQVTSCERCGSERRAIRRGDLLFGIILSNKVGCKTLVLKINIYTTIRNRQYKVRMQLPNIVLSSDRIA